MKIILTEDEKDWIFSFLMTILIVGVIGFAIACNGYRVEQNKVIENPKLEFYSNYTPAWMLVGNPNYTFQEIPLIISLNQTKIMILYSNGTIWVKQGQEKEVGEQLAKVSLVYSSYRNGYCGRLQ